MTRTSSWMAALLTRDPELRALQRRLDHRLRQWEIRRAVGELRREGVAGAVGVAAQRFGVSRSTVKRALLKTGKVRVR